MFNWPIEVVCFCLLAITRTNVTIRPYNADLHFETLPQVGFDRYSCRENIQCLPQGSLWIPPLHPTVVN